MSSIFSRKHSKTTTNTNSDSGLLGYVSSITKTLTQSDVNDFCKLSNNRNPVYWHYPSAIESRYGKHILPPFLTASLIEAAIGGVPGEHRTISHSLEFLGDATPMNTYTASAEVTDQTGANTYRIEATVADATGREYVRGTAEIEILED